MQIASPESEAGFKALFEYATIAILVVGKDGRVELINPSAEKLFGYTNAELIGQPLEILIPQDLRNKHVSHRQGYFENPKARPMGVGVDLYARRKDGSVFPVEIGLGHYSIDGKNLAVAFVTDRTYRKAMEQELKLANEALEQKVHERTLELTETLERERAMSEMKSRFVSMASHEFRTPLSAILSSVSLIGSYKQAEEEPKRAKHVERIKQSVQNLTTILDDFLSLDKLEQGKILIVPEKFSLPDLLEDTVEEVEGMLKKKQQRINYTHNGNNELFQDKKIIRNVVLNLLSNASKYSPEDKEIILTSEQIENKFHIRVQDHGIGIPEEEQKSIFRKFFRAGNVAGIQGTGLGLNIVHKYVELLRGNISFASRAGAGTTFLVELPEKI